MSNKDIDLLGIGSAIVDVFATPEDDSLLNTLNLAKGAMNLVDGEKAKLLSQCLLATKEMSGGTIGNTLAGITSFGGTAAFIGKVGDDMMGERFVFKLQERGVICSIANSDQISTSVSFIIVTPDGVRTMCTNIAPSSGINKDDIDENLLARSKVVLLAGYMFDTEEEATAAKAVIDHAKSYDCKVALTLADYLCVERHRELFIEIMNNSVDYLFCNSKELNTLLKSDDTRKSLDFLLEKSRSTNAIYSVITEDESSTIISKGNIITTPANKNVRVVDKTGAGAAFTSGVIYGHLNGYDLKQCVDIGDKAATQILGTLGARPIHPFRLLKASTLNNLDDNRISEW